MHGAEVMKLVYHLAALGTVHSRVSPRRSRHGELMPRCRRFHSRATPRQEITQWHARRCSAEAPGPPRLGTFLGVRP